jgi:NAD(P)-dependent dehydrogenase (short-subunit alcohol dehydrogenase family)
MSTKQMVDSGDGNCWTDSLRRSDNRPTLGSSCSSDGADSMAGRLSGKMAVVVGAGQQPGETIGNGRAIASLFAQQGAQVLCVDRDMERAQDTAAAITRDGGHAISFQADIVEAAQAAAIIATAEQRMGRIDILVNNVGIGMNGPGGDGPPHVASEAAYDQTMAANLKGMWLTIKAAIPAMTKYSTGSIVNISSLESVGGDSLIAYELSKAGVNRLTVATAINNAKHGLRCNAVSPGIIDTPLAINAISRALNKTTDETRALLGARVPLRNELGTAWDVAHAALFLASDDARYISGVILPVDGAMAARIG